MKTLLILLALSACATQRVKVDPVAVKPIHITVDVNVNDEPEKR